MKKKISVSLALTILFVSLTVCFVVTMLLSTRLFENKIESVNAKEAVYDKISDIDAMVRQNYYSTINNDDILDSLSSGYINGLGDSESRYLTSAEYTHYQDILSGKIYGVGISIIKSKEERFYPEQQCGFIGGSEARASLNRPAALNHQYTQTQTGDEN